MDEPTPLTNGHTVPLTSGTSTSSPKSASPRPIVNISTPVGMLGYGLREEETYDALSKLIQNGAPTAMVLDSGSTDSGPEKLALGCMSAPRSNYKRDLTKLLRLSHAFRVPVIFSSAGGDGSDEHVEEMIKILEEIAREKGNEHYRLKAIAIYSEVKKDFVRQRLASGAVSGCGKPVPQLREEDIDSAPRICSQMGPEPFYDAMIANPDFNVIAGGRGYDPSPYVAFAAYATKTPFTNTATEKGRRMFGAFTHMGKILECGASCATPKGNGAVATIYEDGSFDIKPTDPNSKCTPTSVSAHSLYEKSRPDILSGPGGKLELMHTKYEQLDDDRTVRCRGAEFVFSRDAGLPYQIKLEAARVVGYRSQYMGSYKDPILIGQIGTVLGRTRQYVDFQHQAVKEKWEMDWHIYGKDTRTVDGRPGEIFIIGEALAESQDLANSLVSTARVASVHVPYRGMKATAGAFAYGLGGKVELPLGACAEFSIYHLVDLEEGEERLALSDDSNALYHQKVTMIGVPGLDATPLPAKMPANSKRKAMPIAIPDDGPSVVYDRLAPKTLGELASVLRSKNAGPFELTFDVMFAFEDEYKLIKEFGFLNAATIAQLYNIKEEDVVWSGFFDQALAYKATIPRLHRGKIQGNGGFMESDVHGSNKYLELYYYPLPDEFVEKWKAMRA